MVKKYMVETCKQKTARGNWFLTRREAKESAKRMTRKGGGKVWPYLCRVCGFWHAGRNGKEKAC
jgi:hypothetical protein